MDSKSHTNGGALLVSALPTTAIVSRMPWRTIHRWLAIVLVAPLVIWSITGLLFHLKPGWSRAYDMLDAERPGATFHATQLANVGDFEHLDVFDTAVGPLARVTTAKGTQLLDLGGKPRSPLSIEDARTLALDAVARSAHRAEYGEPGAITATDERVTIAFSAGPVVDVGRADARISQRGPDTDRIDWLYRIHYLQLTGLKTADRVLAVVGLALIWLVMIPGVVLFVTRSRPRRS